MAVKALYVAYDISFASSNVRVACRGIVIGGSAFDEDFIIPDVEAPNLNSDLADVIKGYLSGAPHNVSFGGGDVVRMVPALL